MRGRKLATLQGGLFLFIRNWGFPEDRQPILVERLRDVFPAQVVCSQQHAIGCPLSIVREHIQHHAKFHTNTNISRSTAAALRGTANALLQAERTGSRTASPYFQIHGAVNKDSGRTPRTLAGNPANAERRVPGVKSIHTLLKSFQPSARRLA